MSSRKARRNPLFADAFLESRLSPAVIYYPIAPSIVEFDPVGNREDDPILPGDLDNLDIVVEPEIDLIQTGDPVDTSQMA
ncbi:hypothetical protein GC170_20685 [bacterium]|nr:hypothetical protein [bacterium]